nr:toll-like receptor 22 [Sebastiscus marmoratus]
MAPGVKEDKTMSRGGSECLKLIFLLLNISGFVVPVTGFYLKSCHMSSDNTLCSKGNLSAVPQDIPSKTKFLDLSENKIQKIQKSDFKILPVLTQLDLKRNYISDIYTGGFANLIALKTLNLNNNRLVKLVDDVFEGLSSLTQLMITKNRIKVVAPTAFKSLKNLTFLDISGNKLHHITNVHLIIQHLPNLLKLIVAKNGIPIFQSHELTNSSLKLTALDLSQNPIAVFRITADVFPNLTWLNIGVPPAKRPMKWDIRNKTFVSRVSILDISGIKMASDGMKALGENFNSLTSLRMNGMKHTRLTALINMSCTIPTVSSLQLRRNNIPYINSDFFQLCVNITELDLSENTIQNIQDGAFRALQGLRILSLMKNKLPTVPATMRNISTLKELDLSKNEIKTLGCDDFANLTELRHLSLHENSLSVLQECVFKDLIALQVLKLQSNSISNLGGAFQKYLPNLKQLRLNGNKLTTIKNGEFTGLQSLQNLTLNLNLINSLANGSFKGLTNLTEMQVQGNKIEEKEIRKGAFNHLFNLKYLDLRDNIIKYFESTALSHPPFSKLSRLETLVILGNHRRKKSMLPSNFLQGLTNLLTFNARNIQLLSLHKDTFTYTPRLQTLDISANDLRDLSSDLFHPIQNLTSLYTSTTRLQSLDFLIDANLTKLEFLQARKNQYSVFREEVLLSLPALVYLDIEFNSFTCDCDNAWFRHWVVKNKQTQVVDAYNFLCNYPPDLKNMRLLDLDVRSCTVDNEFLYFVSTTCVILLFMAVSFTYHFLRWQLVYAYYLFLALLFDTKHKNKQAPNQYDAFVSYNTHDEPWVIEELLPKLEEEQGWKLCLHHRDFEPGKPIIDNITDAIYGSRKTICVISHRYLESEWCSREIQVASTNFNQISSKSAKENTNCDRNVWRLGSHQLTLNRDTATSCHPTSSTLAQTTPIFKLNLHFDLNNTSVKVCDCILRNCDNSQG